VQNKLTIEVTSYMRSRQRQRERGINRNHREPEIKIGVLAGLIGGLAGSWMMNQFQAGLAKLSKAKNRSQQKDQDGQQGARPSQSEQQGDGDADATLKLANKIAKTVLHRDLSPEEEKQAGPIVHYGFGGTVGALYGAITEALPATHRGVGLPFGTTVWAVADEAAVPLLGLSKSPQEYPVSSHASALAAHLVYGLTTELVRRTIRGII
jgi:putative membrane protein